MFFTTQLVPLIAQIQAETTVAQKTFIQQILSADPVVKLTLIVLVAFSVVSWAVIFYKMRQIKSAEKSSQNFWNSFSQATTLQEAATQTRERSGPLYEIFEVALKLVPQLKGGGKGRLSVNQLQQKLVQVREEEIYKLEQYTPFLATTASASPFIGLFGTVWGILTAFYAIGKAGNSTLATVGPFISEALIATAIGLAAAIPAVIAYNHFVHKIKVQIKMMGLFLDDLTVKIEEEFNP